MSSPVPCLFERKILPKVWGGRMLEQVPGIALPPGEAIGETWEVFDRPDGSSKLRDDPRTLHDLLTEDRAAWLGRRTPLSRDGRFPLLLKFIDAADRLSLQVHPDDRLAAASHPTDGGKNEAWLILHVGPRGRIVRGFAPGVTPERFRAVAATPEVEPLLHSFTPKVGDVVHLPSGVVHAIGPDVVLFEIQQNSDLTYRLYDWGRPRETHVEQALASLRFDVSPQTVTPTPVDDGTGGEWLVRDPKFALRRWTLHGPVTLASNGAFRVLTVVRGRATLGWRSGGAHPPLLLAPGDSALVPASLEAVFVSPIGETVLVSSEPATN
jgi:mannose-6-phosphate isomerase